MVVDGESVDGVVDFVCVVSDTVHVCGFDGCAVEVCEFVDDTIDEWLCGVVAGGEDVDWSTAAVLAEIAPVDVAGDGTYTVGEREITDSGHHCVSYVMSVAAKDNPKVSVSHEAGMASETALVEVVKPQVCTLAKQQKWVRPRRSVMM